MQSSSPCRDHAKATALPPDIADVDFNNNVQEQLPKDLDFKLRYVAPGLDQGAYEVQIPAGGG